MLRGDAVCRFRFFGFISFNTTSRSGAGNGSGRSKREKTEDRGVCAKTERESKDGNDGERWTFQQTAMLIWMSLNTESIARVLPQQRPELNKARPAALHRCGAAGQHSAAYAEAFRLPSQVVVH